ncbi:unnamed protein product [Triticum turgidum subsp. durum]|uniref:Uncharacterized protein n=1 Tax=Triticum turgidum subsp. durum TaxID=4567 RepID=A0A9R1RJ87_TRITD|nr:unnamed protein product [Triticum turgidum subsp. durum]
MDPHPRAHVPLLVRSQAEPVRRRREHGEAGALRPQRAVPQEHREPAHRPPARQGARAHRRRRLEAPPQGRPPGLQHGQAQDDDGDHVRLCRVNDVGVEGKDGQGRQRGD